jgi:hypothetical protein
MIAADHTPRKPKQDGPQGARRDPRWCPFAGTGRTGTNARAQRFCQNTAEISW